MSTIYQLVPALEGNMLSLARYQVYAADIVVLNKSDRIGKDGRRRVND